MEWNSAQRGGAPLQSKYLGGKSRRTKAGQNLHSESVYTVSPAPCYPETLGAGRRVYFLGYLLGY